MRQLLKFLKGRLVRRVKYKTSDRAETRRRHRSLFLEHQTGQGGEVKADTEQGLCYVCARLGPFFACIMSAKGF